MENSISNWLEGAKTMAKNVFGRKDIYQLQFDHEDDGCWYVHYPGWPFSHHNLMMVAGADQAVALLSDDGKVSKVEVIPSGKKMKMDGYVELEQKAHSLAGGSTYEVHGLPGYEGDIWLCPVTLFVLGEYPKYIYGRKSK